MDTPFRKKAKKSPGEKEELRGKKEELETSLSLPIIKPNQATMVTQKAA